MPEGRTWGSTSAVDVDKRRHVDLGRRAVRRQHVPRLPADPILKFDARRQAAPQLRRRHDDLPARHPCRPRRQRLGDRRPGQPAPARARRAAGLAAPACTGDDLIGHQVFKYSPDGKLLMTLGKAGGGRDADYFYQPNDVLVAPNGDIFVSEGHSSAEGSTRAILKFDKTGSSSRVIGQFRQRPGRVRSAPRAGDGLEGTAVRRRSQQQPDPDPRSGRQLSSRSGRSSAARAASSIDRDDEHSMSPTRNRARSTRPHGGLEARDPDRQRQGRQDHGAHSRRLDDLQAGPAAHA